MILSRYNYNYSSPPKEYPPSTLQVLLSYGAGGDLAVQQADNPEFKNSMHLMIKQAAKKGYMKVLETLIAKVKEAGIDEIGRAHV